MDKGSGEGSKCGGVFTENLAEEIRVSEDDSRGGNAPESRRPHSDAGVKTWQEDNKQQKHHTLIWRYVIEKSVGPSKHS